MLRKRSSFAKVTGDNRKLQLLPIKKSIQLIFRISEVLRRPEKKNEVDLNQSLVATLTKKYYIAQGRR